MSLHNNPYKYLLTFWNTYYIFNRNKKTTKGGDWQVNRSKSIDSDRRSSGYDSGRELVSPDDEPSSHRDKIAKMSIEAFHTTDIRAIAGQQPKV